MPQLQQERAPGSAPAGDPAPLPPALPGLLPAQTPLLGAVPARPSAFAPYQPPTSSPIADVPPETAPEPTAQDGAPAQQPAAEGPSEEPYDGGGFGEGDDYIGPEETPPGRAVDGAQQDGFVGAGFSFPEAFRQVASARAVLDGSSAATSSAPAQEVRLAPSSSNMTPLGSGISLFGQENTMDAHARMLDPDSALEQPQQLEPCRPAPPTFDRDEMPASDDDDAPRLEPEAAASPVPQPGSNSAQQQGHVPASGRSTAAPSDAEQVIDGVCTRWTMVRFCVEALLLSAVHPRVQLTPSLADDTGRGPCHPACSAQVPRRPDSGGML